MCCIFSFTIFFCPVYCFVCQNSQKLSILEPISTQIYNTSAYLITHPSLSLTLSLAPSLLTCTSINIHYSTTMIFSNSKLVISFKAVFTCYVYKVRTPRPNWEFTCSMFRKDKESVVDKEDNAI